MPEYIVIAGVNGAGKSTLYCSLENISNIPRVNTDEIVRSFGDWRNIADVMKAGRIAVKTIREYFERGVSFQQETTLCGKSIINNIHKAKELGYLVEVYFIGVDSSDIAKERVAMRVMNGGHGVSDDIIEKRFYESLDNMKNILDLCDTAIFYDNTARFRCIAMYSKGKLIRENDNLPEWYKKYIK